MPTMVAARAAMVRDGVGAAGELLPQLVPEQPDGNVGGPTGDASAWPAGVELPTRNAWGMKVPSTMADRTTTNDQRHRSGMAQL